MNRVQALIIGFLFGFVSGSSVIAANYVGTEDGRGGWWIVAGAMILLFLGVVGGTAEATSDVADAAKAPADRQ